MLLAFCLLLFSSSLNSGKALGSVSTVVPNTIQLNDENKKGEINSILIGQRFLRKKVLAGVTVAQAHVISFLDLNTSISND
jgi:hypothetical protein